MKYVFYLVFVCCLCSCANTEKENKYLETNLETNNSFGNITEFSYNGHNYIKFVDGLYRCGVVHNPDCKKCKENVDKSSYNEASKI